MYVGEDHETVCWNTLYRQAYLDLVRHGVSGYELACTCLRLSKT
jgi:hypothetical protein